MNEQIDGVVNLTTTPNEAHNHDCEMMAKSGEVLDAILYINLAHREDRKQHVLDEIKKINPSLDRVHRVDALYVQNQGALGASMSHIKALELMIKHPEWERCAIFEDDFTFTPNAATGLNALLSLTDFDVLLLGVGTMAYDEIGQAAHNSCARFSNCVRIHCASQLCISFA